VLKVLDCETFEETKELMLTLKFVIEAFQASMAADQEAGRECSAASLNSPASEQVIRRTRPRNIGPE
jgi:hypothetical protein